jgi:hypothetical protein
LCRSYSHPFYTPSPVRPASQVACSEKTGGQTVRNGIHPFRIGLCSPGRNPALRRAGICPARGMDSRREELSRKAQRTIPTTPATGRNRLTRRLGKRRARNKPGEGEEQVPIGLVNDPVDSCDPVGFPRIDLFSLKAMTIVQTPNYVVWLNQFYNVYRIIWTDGRALPKDPEPRYYGYSVGHWEDDYSFVVDTIGMDERTWLDNVGRPHSSALHVVERFHRVNRDILELTVTIDDPKMYTKPWVAADKLTLHLLPADFDMGEMICSPSEMSDYKKLVANPISGGGK